MLKVSIENFSSVIVFLSVSISLWFFISFSLFKFSFYSSIVFFLIVFSCVSVLWHFIEIL